MRKRVYIETTIPSFYYEVRSAPDMIARREWTRDWWDNQRHHYDLVTSAAVIEELSKGNYPSKEQALALISQVPLLPTVSAIDAIVETYIVHYVMPHNSLGDALHLALTSYHGCHFLLTWNCMTLGTSIHDTELLSEAALDEDWNRPEEEAAWSHLQQAKSS